MGNAYGIYNGKTLVLVVESTQGGKTSREFALEEVKRLKADPKFSHKRLTIAPYFG